MGVKRGRCVGLTTLPPSCADRLEIWLPQPPILACNGIALHFTFTFPFASMASSKTHNAELWQLMCHEVERI